LFRVVLYSYSADDIVGIMTFEIKHASNQVIAVKLLDEGDFKARPS
jgi:hypothetical protein